MLIKLHEWLQVENKLLNRPYIGTVIDNKDPKKLQRIKVTIDKLLEVPKVDAPWVYKKHPSFLGGSPNSSSCVVPEMGSKVVVTFPTGDIYYPQYESLPYPVSDKEAIYDQGSYPDIYGFKDSLGNWFRIDKKRKFIELMHFTGSYMKIVENGSIFWYSVKDINIEAVDHIRVKAGKSISTESGTSTAMKAGTTFNTESGTSTAMKAGTSYASQAGTSSTHQAGTTYSIKAGASYTVTAGGAITETAGGVHSSNGSTVHHG